MKKTDKIIPIEDNRLYFLFRRGREEHIKALYEEGDIYINSIDFIRTCDDNQERSDEDDGILSRQFIGDAKVTIYDTNKDFDDDGITMDALNLVLKNDHKEKGNIYCLTGIYSEHLSGSREDITFDTKSFGESLIFIHKPSEFLNRLLNSLKANGFKRYKSDKVSYYNNNFSGNVGFFKKHEKFQQQSEYRIYIQNSKNEPIRFKIGPLRDIASINTGFIRIKYTDDKEQIITL